MSRQFCTAVSAACPVQGTLYGYYPTLAGNSFLLAIFTACAVIQIVLSSYSRSWSFLVAIAGGCALEAVGYGGRIMMHANPWSSAGFKMQICCLVIAPSFLAAGVYLSLKHIILYVGPEHSRLKPRLYTWTFISSDVFSICVQAVGGGIAAAAGPTNRKGVNTGNALIVTGIALQVATMVVCGVFAVDFALRYRKGRHAAVVSESSLKHSGPVIDHAKFKIFCAIEIVAYFCVLIRCIYRIPEMAGGWGNPLMRNEKEFLVLDGMMIAIAAVLFTVFHPTFWFPPMTGRYQKQHKLSTSAGGVSSDVSS